MCTDLLCGAISPGGGSVNTEFDRDLPIYYGSELVTGVVRVMQYDINLQRKQLSVQLFGKATYETIVRRDSGDEHEIVTFTFFCEEAILNQTSDGKNSWPFEIQSPTHAPPTFEIPHIFHKNHPAIEYSVVACLQESMFGITDTKKILFCPPILIKPQSTVEIDNPQNIQIKWVDCIIEQTLQVENDHARTIIINDVLPTITGGTGKHIEGTFGIRLPENIPPTFTFDKIKGKMNPSVNISYSIKFEVCVVGFLTDFSVTEPLIISTDPWKHENDGTITLTDRAQTPQLSLADNQ